ncbi:MULTISPECIES: DUF6243 family protein [unclassified Streptomyces]|uniref:DUF6243 family protein n=1 Tax=unclassified Streptomyces TaxID=2593676 RepID=UPI000DACF227|nr:MULTISPECIES: DUF6243 family protein [unclassified Streptomyces]PZT74982.1 hypothetical protein DNK55_23440 [Streptomyces sp. AC1-42T]PZT82034.1 hypothetical protein DNK56_08005 [Streptomyces sp. AC1-42W]
MAKSRNNLLGVGGQRKKLSRAGAQGAGPAGEADRRSAADQKQELLRRMRERAAAPTTDAPETPETDTPTEEAPAQD